MPDVDALAWPASRLAELMAALASGCAAPRAASCDAIGSPPADEELVADWVEACARWHGVAATPTESSCADVERLVFAGAPALLRISGPARVYVAVVRASRRRAIVLCPDLSRRKVRADELAAAIVRERAKDALDEVDRDLEAAGVDAAAAPRVRASLVRERLARIPIRGHFLLRTTRVARGGNGLSEAGVARPLALAVLGHATVCALSVACFWILGESALSGRADRSWLFDWALVLLTLAASRWMTHHCEGEAALRAGAWLKHRLFDGALRLEADEMRLEGVGSLLGRVIESDAVESLAMNGGLLSALAVVELATGIAVLSLGAGGALSIALLVALLAAGAWGTARYARLRKAWAQARIDLTGLTIEKMIGYRTRLVQEPRERWHEGEDDKLERYLRAAEPMDAAWTRLVAALPHVWLLLGLAALAPTALARAPGATEIAIAVGGVLLTHRSLVRLTSGMLYLADAAVSWQTVQGIFTASARDEVPAAPMIWRERSIEADEILSADKLTFQHPGRAEPAVHRVDLSIRAGDRILVEGPSGGGKSTLASLLAGLRPADSGLLLLGGLDRKTTGSRWWRRRVVCAPQFHENHVLTQSLLFNVLMGVRWPAPRKLVERAETVCRELGLGDLIDRMPAGMGQIVGESGWQLSHGERSRLFIARTLLQDPDVVVLDESLAALDPETFRTATRCIFSRARSLVLIAHP